MDDLTKRAHEIQARLRSNANLRAASLSFRMGEDASIRDIQMDAIADLAALVEELVVMVARVRQHFGEPT